MYISKCSSELCGSNNSLCRLILMFKLKKSLTCDGDIICSVMLFVLWSAIYKFCRSYFRAICLQLRGSWQCMMFGLYILCMMFGLYILLVLAAAVGKFCCRTIGMFTMFWIQTLSKFSHRFVIVSIFIEYLNNFVLLLESSQWIKSAIIVLNYIYIIHIILITITSVLFLPL